MNVYPDRRLDVQSVLLHAGFLVQVTAEALCIILSIASHVSGF